MMAYAIVQSVDSVVGFDTTMKITQDLSAKFYSIGYRFAIRYLPLGSTADPQDLTNKETQDILTGGLGLMPCQHVRYSGWIPTATMGLDDGRNAGIHARDAGIIPGTTVWLDLEGINISVSHQVVMDYCKAWFNEVKTAGYLPGLYVGDGAILTSNELYSLPFTRYWKSASIVPGIATRGYCMVQSLYQWPVFGIDIDRDTIRQDALGGIPTMMINSNNDNKIQNVLSDIHTDIAGIINQLGIINNKISGVIS